jgi:hypothetical protein
MGNLSEELGDAMDEAPIGLSSADAFGCDAKQCIRLRLAFESKCRRRIDQGFDARSVCLIKTEPYERE